MEAGISVSIQALGGSDCHPREYLPASQRQTHLHATCTAGRTRWGTEAGQRGRGFSDHEFITCHRPHRICERNNSAKKIGSGARKVLDETPSRVVPVLLLDANGHISQTPWPEQIGKYSSKKTTFNGQCLGELLRDHHLQAANTYFPVGATFFGPFSNTQIDFACLPATVHVHRCCALHHDGDRLQLAAAPGRRDHRPIQCVFQHQLTYGIHEKRQEHQWDKNKLTQGALFAQDRTAFLSRVEEACRHDEEWNHLAVTDFWAKLNQVLVTAGSDLYAREIQARISTPQDTLDARHDMTEVET